MPKVLSDPVYIIRAVSPMGELSFIKVNPMSGLIEFMPNKGGGTSFDSKALAHGYMNKAKTVYRGHKFSVVKL